VTPGKGGTSTVDELVVAELMGFVAGSGSGDGTDLLEISLVADGGVESVNPGGVLGEEQVQLPTGVHTSCLNRDLWFGAVAANLWKEVWVEGVEVLLIVVDSLR